MTKNIVIAVLTFLLFTSLVFSFLYKTHADKMTSLAEANALLAEEAKVEATHAQAMVKEALKEANFQREQAAEKVAFLEAQLQKSGRAPYKEK